MCPLDDQVEIFRYLIKVLQFFVPDCIFFYHGGVNTFPLDKMAAILADIFKCIFLNENDRIPIQIALKFIPDGPIDNNPALV